MKYFNSIAEKYLKLGNRVFETDSPSNELLIVWSVKKSKENLKRNFKENPKVFANPKDVVLVRSRLVNSDSSIPFKQPHPYHNVKVNIIEELFL